MLKIDKSLDHQQINNEQDEHKDGDESSQQVLLSEKGIVDHSQLSLVHKLIPPKWFTKVKIVVSPDYHFTVIAMIDSGADIIYIYINKEQHNSLVKYTRQRKRMKIFLKTRNGKFEYLSLHGQKTKRRKI